MRIDYPSDFIVSLLEKQLSFFLVTKEELAVIESAMPATLKRVEHCFKFTTNKYYRKEHEVYFNPFHSCQWCIFLYYLSNTLYRNNPDRLVLCDKIYYLNRMLNGCDLFYQTRLPDIFMLDHPLGSVMGKAEYGDYFFFSQGCTVGNNKGVYPKIGSHVRMLSDSKIIGATIIGDNVLIAANAYVKDEIIKGDSVVFGASPHLVVKRNAGVEH